jgi:hypothetical protein
MAAAGELQLDYVKSHLLVKVAPPLAALATVINIPDESGQALKVCGMC